MFDVKYSIDDLDILCPFAASLSSNHKGAYVSKVKLPAHVTRNPPLVSVFPGFGASWPRLQIEHAMSTKYLDRISDIEFFSEDK